MKQPRVLALLVCALASGPVVSAVDLPRPATEFTIQINNSKPLLLSQYKGKPVVLAFILTTCPHCQKAIACLSKGAADFAPRGLQVLAVAVDDAVAAKNVPGFIRTFHPPFPVGYTTDKNSVLDFMEHPRAVVPLMPMLVFIDKDGVIRAQLEGDSPLLEEKVMEDNLHKQIDNLLKPPKKLAPLPKKSS
jgi:peroxiredoxin